MNEYNKHKKRDNSVVKLSSDDDRTTLTFTNLGEGFVVKLPDANLRANEVAIVSIVIPEKDLNTFMETLEFVPEWLEEVLQIKAGEDRQVIDDQSRRWRSLEDAAWSVGLKPEELDKCITEGTACKGRTYRYV